MKDLCIIVPYRDRKEHLDVFVPAINSYLDEKKISHEVLVVEQEHGKAFNRGKLLNIGFSFCENDFKNFCFHDIDMIPEDSDYSYSEYPVHLAKETEQFGYKLPYDTYFGGVTLFDKDSFEKINGFSNEFWGWGGEDDELFNRCKAMNVKVMRRKGRYKSLFHDRFTLNSENEKFYKKNLERLNSMMLYFDGSMFVEGLSTLKYEMISNDDFFSHKKITVSI